MIIYCLINNIRIDINHALYYLKRYGGLYKKEKNSIFYYILFP
jgi:hypothetical protein